MHNLHQGPLMRFGTGTRCRQLDSRGDVHQQCRTSPAPAGRVGIGLLWSLATARAFAQYWLAQPGVTTFVAQTVPTASPTNHTELWFIRFWLYFGRLWLNRANPGRSGLTYFNSGDGNGRPACLFDGGSHHHYNNGFPDASGWHCPKPTSPAATGRRAVNPTRWRPRVDCCGHLAYDLGDLGGHIRPAIRRLA